MIRKREGVRVELAQKLSGSPKSSEKSIHAIGEGWVGEEAVEGSDRIKR
jgi:hypothetical protein